MASGRTLKFALCEVLQFAGLCVPLFIVMQRFALIVARVKSMAQPPGDASTAYWLTVASSIAYVTSAALLVWVPMKYMVFTNKKFLVQINNSIRQDTFAELPVSLVLFSLICIDIVERIRRQFSMSGLSSRSACSARSASMSADHSVSPNAYTGALRFLCASDARAEVFVDSFLFWMDTVEMVRVAGHPAVYYSGWVFPIYIFSYLSCLRLVVMPHSPLLSLLGVALQDLPFLFVRIGLIAFFGFVTPLLYLMKNLLVCLAFIYFNFMTKLRVFNTERMF
uniref:Transmembrane protein 236 n=1 Tax=Oncorhynchus mykiss TaxID=8022 RepID=A0A8C7VNA5_ONCMY